MKPHLYIAIPAMDELEYLPKTLSAIAAQQTDYEFSVYVCVNQPEMWWDDEQKKVVCENNAQLLAILKNHTLLRITVIDRSSRGYGWRGKDFGVGQARKTIFEEILKIANQEDIIISLDADTIIGERYLQSIGDNFAANPEFPAIAVPYYHPLNGNDLIDRVLLRYEIYLRNWYINMARIGSPYAFTALGSAIALKVKILKKIGNITPLKSGEDFYLLQKIRKMTPINTRNEEPVYPSGRISNRVFFGTGPAISKGMSGDWKSYPIFHHSLFEPVREAYEKIEKLFTEDVENSFLLFLQEQFNDTHLWEPLRKNHKDLPHFQRAFHEKADGLRIFQFIRQEHEKLKISDEESLRNNLKLFNNDDIPDFLGNGFSFDELSVTELDEVRGILRAIS
ncbi:glycosyltransferase [Bacteroidales bacterium OttesenSCG-928-L19]|nr:glycosyltransferase [Bacteroidales bacterium OttesenSCG-928-L19]